MTPIRFSQQEPYHFLIVADKFQTGYDEPLLHTMYVDKQLSDIKAVQTLSRLNRAHPQKSDTFVLDFINDADTIQKAFADYYRTTLLSEETDPDKLHDLKAALDRYQVYSPFQVDHLARLFLGGAERDMLDPILDTCVAVYTSELDEDEQIDFKGKAKAFGRTYQFLASILPYCNAEWEKLSIFLNFLVPKLPAPKEDDLSKGIIETIDMDSYRVEVKEALKISLPDQDTEIDPVPTDAGGRIADPKLDFLSNILKTFNEQFGNIDWKDADRIRQVIAEEIPSKVAADKAYQNAIRNSDKPAARLEHDRALQKVVVGMLSDHTELFKQFSDNPSFKKWLSDSIFGLTYVQPSYGLPTLVHSLIEQTVRFVHRQFGPDKKWAQINQAIWTFFHENNGERLGLSTISKFAADLSISVDDFLSVLSLLTGPDQKFIRSIYYRKTATGEVTDVPAVEIAGQTRRWVYDHEIDEVQWRDWASNVFVGWAPDKKIQRHYSLH